MSFESVVCAVDSTEASLVAADRAARLATVDGKLILISAEEIAIVGDGMAGYATAITVPYDGAATDAIARAERVTSRWHRVARTVPVEGPFEPALLDLLTEEAADLVVLGTHGHTRLGGILAGSKATHALHVAPCSVLIARGEVSLNRWPSSIVVGVDGSDPSYAAYAVAAALADRFDASLAAVMLARDYSLDDVARVKERIPPLLLDHESATVDGLLAQSTTADLLVLGNRGLRGVRALGSVSERVAHESDASVLVVRHAGR